MTLTSLARQLQRPVVELWMGLLLGGFQLQQTGEFYQGEVQVLGMQE